MTREVAKAAIDALAGKELAAIVLAFSVVKDAARRAGVPHAGGWQLDYLAGAVAPWQIVDRDAADTPAGTGRVAVALQSRTAACLQIELHAYSAALSGLAAIHAGRPSPQLTAPSRR